MKIQETVERKELKDKAVSFCVPEGDGNIETTVIPNAEALALTIINLIDKYMSKEKGGDD